jgi:hypothetical protein
MQPSRPALHRGVSLQLGRCRLSGRFSSLFAPPRPTGGAIPYSGRGPIGGRALSERLGLPTRSEIASCSDELSRHAPKHRRPCQGNARHCCENRAITHCSRSISGPDRMMGDPCRPGSATRAAPCAVFPVSCPLPRPCLSTRGAGNSPWSSQWEIGKGEAAPAQRAGGAKIRTISTKPPDELNATAPSAVLPFRSSDPVFSRKRQTSVLP